MTITRSATVRAPAHLRPATRAWFREVVSTWTLEPHHIRLLTLAAESWDRCSQAREAIAKDGLIVSTATGGQKAHPGVRIEVEARISFAKLLRELDLDVSPPSAARRPPALRSMTGSR